MRKNKLFLWGLLTVTLMVGAAFGLKSIFGHLKERKLLAVIKQWRDKPQEEFFQTTAEAIRELGKMKSQKAIPELIGLVEFNYRENKSDSGNPFVDVQNVEPITNYAVAVGALRTIGPKVVEPVIARIGKLDLEKDAGVLYRLRQVLLGVVDRESAIEIVKSNAQKQSDDIVEERLLWAAESMKKDRIRQ